MTFMADINRDSRWVERHTRDEIEFQLDALLHETYDNAYDVFDDVASFKPAVVLA